MAKRKLAPRINLLSAREVLNARDCELTDGGGLIMRCAGARAAWVFRYTAPNAKRREMGLGVCDRQNARAAGDSLTRVRGLAAKAREMLASIPPIDPIDDRDRAKAAAKEAESRAKAEKNNATATLARVARAYHAKFIEPRTSSKLAADWIHSLENHVPAATWHKPMAEVTRAELLDILRDLQHRMADTAQRVRQRLDEVYDDALEHGTVTINHVAMLRTKLRRENKSKRSTPHPSLPYRDAPAFILQVRTHPGIAARALEFTILTAARTSEVTGAQWAELDLNAATWIIPGQRMKGGEPHTVHLSDRTLAILREMAALSSQWVFPSAIDHNERMSNMAMLALLGRMKRDDITVHGFRATFSTWANETAAGRPDVIEACLAHTEADKIRAAYNRAQFTTERQKLLTTWAAYLDGQQAASNIFELTSAKAA